MRTKNGWWVYSVCISLTCLSIQCGFLEDVLDALDEDDIVSVNNFDVETTFITVPSTFFPGTAITPVVPIAFQPRSIVSPVFFPPVFPTVSTVQVVPSVTSFSFNDPFDPFLLPSLNPLSSDFGVFGGVNDVTGTLMTTSIGTTQFQQIIDAAQRQLSSSIFNSPPTRLGGGQSAFVMLQNEERFVTELQPDFRNSITSLNSNIRTVSTGPGFEMQITPTISANQTSFRTTLSPSTGVLFSSPSIVSASSGMSIATDRLLMRSASVQTTATLKQDEVLLLGGFRDGGVTKQGVLSVFGNVPVVSRGVDQRIVRDDQILIVLIRPRMVSSNVE
jgi:hypothetical protein